MPFLRRRGVQASDSDMRRHNETERSSSGNANKFHTLPRFPSKRPASRDEQHPTTTSAADTAAPSSSSTSSLSAVPETNAPALVVVPAPPITPPHDANVSTSSLGLAVPSVSEPIDRPVSPPIQEESSKHRRFSMLRFRNASDSQLAAKARLQAAAEKPPPTPRGTFGLAL